MKSYLHMTSDLYGGELFGEYESPDEAAQCAARILLEAFNLHDGTPRSFRIIEAEDREQAEAQLLTEVPEEFGDIIG